MTGDNSHFIQRWHTRRGLPHNPCIRCYDETDTFFFVYGDAEWTGAAVMAVVGLDAEEAHGTVEVMRRQHGRPPDERHTAYIRMCANCMAQSGTSVPLYTEAELTVEGGFKGLGIVQTDEHMRRALGEH